MARICVLLSLIVVVLSVSTTNAQHLDTAWTRTYWDGYFDSLNCIAETSDHGFIMTVVTWAEGESQTVIMLVKTDSLGIQEWSIELGSDTNYECGYHVLETSDGSYLVSARSDITGSRGGGGIWIVRTDAAGDTLWTVPWCPEDRSGFPLHACRTHQGGYAITGLINLSGQSNDGFILVLNDDGDILHHETYGDGSYQDGQYIAQAADSGFYMAGQWDDYYGSGYDWWVKRTDKNLATLWDSTYALSDYYDEMHGACLVEDGLVMVGLKRGVGHTMPTNRVEPIQRKQISRSVTLPT